MSVKAEKIMEGRAAKTAQKMAMEGPAKQHVEEEEDKAAEELFERRLPENCVEYMLFVITTQQQVEAGRMLSRLEDIRRAALDISGQLTGDHIWQRESFDLCLESKRGLTYLYGCTDYGDCVEDEWLCVYLLREVSRRFADVWIRVFDSDGEFLLIEAASAVPTWLNPEIDANRVWIHQGNLRIIPLDPSAKTTGSRARLTLSEGVHVIKTEPQSLIHSPFIEAEAFYRLDKYPDQIGRSIHHTLATIPRRLAYILHDRPKAVAPAIEAFYLRDSVSMKSIFSPSPILKLPPEDLVNASVRFTKVLFAQVKSQTFRPPPIWEPLIQAADAETSSELQGPSKLSMIETGMKLTCGFEMMVAMAEKSNSRVVQEVALILQDMEEDGDDVLPTDADIQLWQDVGRHDDEAWLDIDYEEFERELEGRSKGPAERGKGGGQGFGDATAKADLRKMVSRFEAFLNDENAGIDGAEVDEMDEDDESGGSEDESSTDEDKQVSFDEDQFADMMREMMGLPTEEVRGKENTANATTLVQDSSEGEDDGVRELAAQMESELRQYGALLTNAGPQAAPAIKDTEPQAASSSRGPLELEIDESNAEVDIDYNLAKNLLESFKSQAGMSGPAGNILGMMGISLPRDEDEEVEP